MYKMIQLDFQSWIKKICLRPLVTSTLWHPGGFGDFRKKNSSFRLPY